MGTWIYSEKTVDSINQKIKAITITISEDGMGSYEENESELGLTHSSSISSFPVKIENSTISIKIFNLGKELKIDREPYLENQKWHMTIDGKTFEKQ
jgi:hypothetical protein